MGQNEMGFEITVPSKVLQVLPSSPPNVMLKEEPKDMDVGVGWRGSQGQLLRGPRRARQPRRGRWPIGKFRRQGRRGGENPNGGQAGGGGGGGGGRQPLYSCRKCEKGCIDGHCPCYREDENCGPQCDCLLHSRNNGCHNRFRPQV